MSVTHRCPNPQCRTDADGYPVCPSCGLPMSDTALFYPSRFMSVLYFLLYSILPVIAGKYVLDNHWHISTGAYILCGLIYVIWVVYFWRVVTKRNLDLYIISPMGIHVVPYAKGRAVRHVPWRDIKEVSKSTRQSASKSVNLHIKLNSGEVLTVDNSLHDADGMFSAISRRSGSSSVSGLR